MGKSGADFSIEIDDRLSDISGGLSAFDYQKLKAQRLRAQGTYNVGRRNPKPYPASNFLRPWNSGRNISAIPSVLGLVSGNQRSLSPQQIMERVQRNLARLRQNIRRFRP